MVYIHCQYDSFVVKLYCSRISDNMNIMDDETVKNSNSQMLTDVMMFFINLGRKIIPSSFGEKLGVFIGIVAAIVIILIGTAAAALGFVVKIFQKSKF